MIVDQDVSDNCISIKKGWSRKKVFSFVLVANVEKERIIS